jgi:hypothetical protein
MAENDPFASIGSRTYRHKNIDAAGFRILPLAEVVDHWLTSASVLEEAPTVAPPGDEGRRLRLLRPAHPTAGTQAKGLQHPSAISVPAKRGIPARSPDCPSRVFAIVLAGGTPYAGPDLPDRPRVWWNGTADGRSAHRERRDGNRQPQLGPTTTTTLDRDEVAGVEARPASMTITQRVKLADFENSRRGEQTSCGRRRRRTPGHRIFAYLLSDGVANDYPNLVDEYFPR